MARMLDAPHTDASYLLRQMDLTIARRHARKLRRIAVALGFVLPLVLTGLACLIGGAVGVVTAIAAALCAMAGVLVECWLFFAQATHTVTLNYGASA